MDPTIKSVLETLEEIGKRLETLNETPNTAPAAPATETTSSAPARRLMAQPEMHEMRSKLMGKSVGELSQLFSIQARRGADAGVPFEAWAYAGGTPVSSAVEADPMLRKALDTTGATALIRQDLEPVLYALFVKTFPYWDRIAKEPANGLVHAYNQITAYGDAQFMTELGTVTDDVSTYVRQTSNVSVIGTRRGISLKSQFAVLQGGAGYNPEQLELQAGMRAIAHKMQKTIFQGNATVSGGTSSDENGGYDANSFDGLRKLLSSATGDQNVNPQAATPDDMRKSIDLACTAIMNAGGTAGVVITRPDEKTTFDLQQDKNVRYMDTRVEVAPGILTNAVNTVFGPLPLVSIPGDSVGTYSGTFTFPQGSASATVADQYVLDESTISMPYLGSEGPTVLEIPIGISGQLTHLYIMFGMWGLAVKAPNFSAKVRVHQ